MAGELDLLNSTEKPALLGISSPDLLAASTRALEELAYRPYGVATHGDFLSRFVQAQYQVVLLEELFNASSASENQSLAGLRAMPMSQRRHAVSFLLGPSFQTLHPMQAFQQSVHAVVHPADVGKLSQIVQKVVADYSLFYTVYREAQLHLAQGK